MRKLIIILLSLVSTIVVGQKIYTIIPASKYVKHVFDKPSDSIIDVFHNYVNNSRKDLPTTSKRIELDLSSYNQHLQPFVMNDKLNKEAQRRCEEYVNFYLNYHWYNHMYERKFNESLAFSEYDNDTIDFRKVIKEHEKVNTPHNKMVVNLLKNKLNRNPTHLIDKFLYDDGNVNIITGHRDMLLSKGDDLFEDNQIGYGFVEYNYQAMVYGKKRIKTIHFLVILTGPESRITDVIVCKRNKLETIKSDYFNSIALYYDIVRKRKIMATN